MSDNVRVLVYCSGGVVQSVHAGSFVDVLIIDADDAADDAAYQPTIETAAPWCGDCERDWIAALAAKTGERARA